MNNIKIYLKDLQFRENETVDNVVEICSNLIGWLENISPELHLTSDHVQAILYASMVLQTYTKMLSKSSLTKTNASMDKYTLKTLRSFLENEQPLVYYSKRILGTVDSLEHFPAIEHYFRTFASFDTFTELIEKEFKNTRNDESCSFLSVCGSDENENPQRDEAMGLVRKIFRMHEEKFETLISRLIENVNFDCLAWIIVEEDDTPFYSRCLIIQNEICNRLNDRSISPRFFASIYEISSINRNGLNLFYKCLSKEMFAASLMRFFLEYLQSFTDFDDLQPMSSHENFRRYNFYELTFLIGAALSFKSAIRIDMYKTIYSSFVNENLIDFVNQRKFTHDY